MRPPPFASLAKTWSLLPQTPTSNESSLKAACKKLSSWQAFQRSSESNEGAGSVPVHKVVFRGNDDDFLSFLLSYLDVAAYFFFVIQRLTIHR